MDLNVIALLASIALALSIVALNLAKAALFFAKAYRLLSGDKKKKRTKPARKPRK